MSALLCLALALALIPQQAPRSESGTFEARFVRDGTGIPIPDVRVTIQSTPGNVIAAAGNTDGNGRFLVRGLAPGTYVLIADTAGYLSQRGNGPQGPIREIFRVDTAQILQPLTFNLIPAATISGRILESDGKPLAARTVEFLRISSDPQGRKIWQIVSRERTNDRGEYRNAQLRTGDYYIRITAAPLMAPTTVAAGIGIVAYYPATTDSAAAAPIAVREGHDIVADFRIPAIKTYRVSGRVINAIPNIDRLPYLAFSLAPRESAGPMELNPELLGALALPEGNDGNYEIQQVPPGSYDLFVRGAGDYLTKVPLEVRDEDIRDFNVVMQPGRTVRGQLVIDGDPEDYRVRPSPLTGAAQQGGGGGRVGPTVTRPGPKDVRVDLIRRDNFRGVRYSLGPSVDESGRGFTFENVPDGSYTVSATLAFNGDAYLADVRVAGRSILSEGLIVGNDLDGIQVLIETKGASIEGIVQRKDRQVVRILLYPDVGQGTDESRYRIMGMTELNQSGSFTIKGIPPGNYKLLALSGNFVDTPIPYMSREFLGQYQSRAVSVTLQKGEARTGVEVPTTPFTR